MSLGDQADCIRQTALWARATQGIAMATPAPAAATKRRRVALKVIRRAMPIYIAPTPTAKRCGEKKPGGSHRRATIAVKLRL